MKSKSNVLIVVLVIIIIIVAAILIFGSSEEELPAPVPENEEQPSVEPVGSLEEVSGTGTIYYIDLEGGFYGILSDDGVQYQPVNLSPGMQVDGLRVQFSGQFVEDSATIAMWGIPITISEASVIADIVPGEPTEEEFLEEELLEEEGGELIE